MNEAYVTGLGAVSPLGPDVSTTWDALCAGRSGLRPVQRFDASAFLTDIGGEVADASVDGDPHVAFAIAAAREAWEDAGLDPEHRAGAAVVMGTSAGGHGAEAIDREDERTQRAATARRKAASMHRVAAVEVAARLGVTGPALTASCACASGNAALDVALALIREGMAAVVVVGGSDSLSPRRWAGFHALGALAPGRCAPFSSPAGMNLGEGAGFLVLESATHASARGARVRAQLLGTGTSADGWHATAPEPRGHGMARAMAAALRDAGVTPAEIGYYNAHGTGTELNDAAEWRAVESVFGAPPSLVASATKGALGHAFGGSGGLEAVITVRALEEGRVPPTTGFAGPRPHGPVDPVAEGRARPHAFATALSHNAAFGGCNASVVFGRPRSSGARSRRVVRVVGVGTALGAPNERLPVEPLRRFVRNVDPREVDPVGAFLLAASARALDDAGLVLHGELRDRAGLFVGTSRRAWTSNDAFRRSYAERGPARANAPAFARTVMNAAPGLVSRSLGLRGATHTLATGPGSGLFALALAYWAASSRPDAEIVVAGGFDELDPFRLGLDPEGIADEAGPGAHGFGEGAACVVLGGDRGPVVSGAWIGGRDGLAAGLLHLGRVDAIYSSAAGPMASRREVEAVARSLPGTPIVASPAARYGFAEATTAVAALVDAVNAVREGGVRSALVVADDPECGACAVRVEVGDA